MMTSNHNIDIDRCRRAMVGLDISGVFPGGEAASAVEDAIRDINADGAIALAQQYIGVKVYAGFGPQRSDRPYGYGPSHGTIVFKIGRANSAVVLGADHVYLIECARDFKGIAEAGPNGTTRRIGLCEAIRQIDRWRCAADQYESDVLASQVESHELMTDSVGRGNQL
jgi:hypothetical protein